MRINNLHVLRQRRRALRAALTPAEARLWTYLQGSGLQGRKFRRQHSVGPYVVDLYCPREKLAIELDGAVHDNDAANRRDEARAAYLEGLGVRVLRIENRSVFEDPDAVVALIAQHFTGG